MITVQLNRPDFEYDIHSLFKAFFPSEEVCVSADKKDVNDQTSLYAVTDYLTDTIEIAFFDRDDPMDAPKLKRVVSVDFSNRKETKNRLKQAYYQMLCDYTGRTLPWGDLTGIRPTKIPLAFLEEGRQEDVIRRYMKDTYFTSDEKINLSIEIAKREIAVLSGFDYQNGYSLYVGIPFCPSACLYCSFTSFPIGTWKERIDLYLDALERELDFVAASYAHKQLHTVYIGGGTPTVLEPPQLKRLIGKIQSDFDLSHCLEFTVEAGRPDSITPEKLAVGISRISINPQTMHAETLKIIGRNHTPLQAIESFHLAREMGFDNINMDLIVGLPNETSADVEATLRQTLELGPDNLTVHSLAIKRAARLRMFREEYRDLTFTNTEQIIGLTADYAKRMGLQPYYLYRQKNMAGNFENVGYAKPGKEGIYNILIMEEKQSIIACGAGSITKRVYPDGRMKRCENVKDVASFIERIDEMIERKRKLLED